MTTISKTATVQQLAAEMAGHSIAPVNNSPVSLRSGLGMPNAPAPNAPNRAGAEVKPRHRSRVAFKLTEKEWWRLAVHEAAHWIFSEWTGAGNVQGVSIVPKDGNAGICLSRLLPITIYQRRMAIMTLCAGSAAENAITGTHRYIQCTDYDQAHQIARSISSDTCKVVREMFYKAEAYAGGVLWVPIVTAATLLLDAKTIGASDAEDIWWAVRPEGQPWLIPDRNEGLEGVEIINVDLTKKRYPSTWRTRLEQGKGVVVWPPNSANKRSQSPALEKVRERLV
jgi:hypothetical protein